MDRVSPMLLWITALCSLNPTHCGAGESTIHLAEVQAIPTMLRAEPGESRSVTWWLPPKADEYVLPITSGVAVNPSSPDQMRWLRHGSPWNLLELPVLGARYGDRQVVVIVPWPHYAEIVAEDRVGIRYTFPEDRNEASPAEIIVMEGGPDPLQAAYAFRAWRRTASDIGALSRPRPLTEKVAALDKVTRLYGAPHFYLWGPALFSRHDVHRQKWVSFARALRDAPVESAGARLVGRFTEDQRKALDELAVADWPMDYLTVAVAGAIDAALSDRDLAGLAPEATVVQVIEANKRNLAAAFGEFLNPPESWGDGLSTSLLDGLHEAGIDRALLLLSDLYGRAARPDVAARAEALGYLLGPYDSYHSVHSPDAGPDNTWETAQFDRAAFENGRVINRDGSDHSGFKRRGFHFAPQAAWPYVRQRVNGILAQTPYTAWFVDCDATGEGFDDFSADHPATKLEDTRLRRQRLAWLESDRGLVVGSEGGSALFADVIHFGHGVQTPYIGHLDPAFRDRQSPHYLGRHWPPDTPEQSFKPLPLPSALESPYFDPAVRIPLYQAALGDEVIATHHWSFDSLKFANVATPRELLEILYRVPPMYHLNRQTWPERRERVLKHLAFWGPLHRELAAAPLVGFSWLSEDRLLQRTTFSTDKGSVTITVNFSGKPQGGLLPYSATVSGASSMAGMTYHAGQP